MPPLLKPYFPNLKQGVESVDQIASLCQSELEVVRAAAREATLSFGKVQHCSGMWCSGVPGALSGGHSWLSGRGQHGHRPQGTVPSALSQHPTGAELPAAQQGGECFS